jgi:hypothetical protein
MTAIRDLITEITAAAARGSRELDAKVFEALGYEVKRDHGRMGYAYRGRGPLRYHQGDHWASLGSLTGDLERAVRYLLPPGWRIAEMTDGIVLGGHQVCSVSLWRPGVRGGPRHASAAATPALAVVAAGLRAYEDGAPGWNQ